MRENLLELTEQEKAFKKMYMGDAGKLLSAPMQYAQYCRIVQEHPEYVNLKNFYEDRTKENMGNTISELNEIESGEEITVQVHERYGYPILHNHSFIEIAYVYSGSCTHYIEKQSFTMQEGDLCILAPNSAHVITALHDEDVIVNILVSKEVLDVSFLRMVKEKQLLAEFFEDILYGRSVSPYLLFPTGADPWMHRIILEMHREANERKYAYRESLELYVRQLFIHVLRDYEMMARVAVPSRKKENDIVFVLGYIAANYNQITLKELAEFFHYSEAYMSRFLKKYTGKTFGKLITELQMKRAVELMRETKLSLNDIAQEVGCFDYSHFSRKFREYCRESPGSYREKVKNIHPKG